ncbi:MAG TPA: methyltransferase domain-containing protein [Thermoanaerobaculia bacterium]|nr:methyltransferase domain-containing protein [Thermoanaerobaculia bacterium]
MNLEPLTSADIYASRIGRTLNSGFVALLISIGHRTRLFDTMAALPPSTSNDIAVAAGLTERYVREWLAAMTAARIVHYDVRTGTYFLPIEYAAALTRGAGTSNLAPAAELLAMLAGVEDLVVAGFHSGGGVMPEAYERVHALLSMEKRQLIDEEHVRAMLELAPGLERRLAAGACVLDAGCGDGAVLLTMARMFPRSGFRGYDLSQRAIDDANERLGESGVRNVEFVVADVARYDEPRSYDLVLALESIHEQAFPRLALRSIAHSLKRDGVFVMQEVAASSHLARNADNPYAPMLYALSLLHAVPVAIAQDGEALGRMWGEERARQMLREAGFTKTSAHALPSDPLRMFFVSSR